MIAAVCWVEDEGLGASGELVFCPESFDQIISGHVAAGADEEARFGAEFCVDGRLEAFIAVRMACFDHHFEDFVAVVFDIFDFHMYRSGLLVGCLTLNPNLIRLRLRIGLGVSVSF